MAVARRIRFNPNNKAQYYVLFSDGRITSYGGSLNPMAAGTPPQTWNPPDFPATDFQVIDWTNPSGYTLDYFGRVHPWGNTPPTNPFPFPVATDPFGIVPAFVMDPAGNGAGYYLRIDGVVVAFGGSPSITTATEGDTSPYRAIQMDWATKRYYVQTGEGLIYQRQGAVWLGQGVRPYAGWDIMRDFEVTDWTGGGAQAMDGWGGIHPIGTATMLGGTSSYTPNLDIWVDFVIIDDGSNPAFPLRFAQLDKFGSVAIHLNSQAPYVIVGATEPPATVTTTTRPRVLFDYVDPENDQMIFAELAVYTQTVAGGFTNAVHSLTGTGSATGGTFALDFSGQVTTNLAYNATASAVAAALIALPNVGTGDVAASGGPLPAAVNVTWQGQLGRCAQTLESVKNALTGGTSPKIVVATATAGTPVFDPYALGGALWHETTNDPTRRQFLASSDIPNGQTRAFMRVRDSSGLESATHSKQWNQNVTLPATPTVAVEVRGGLTGIAVTPSFSSFPTGAQFVIEFSDDYTTLTPELATWDELRYATADAIQDPTTGATWRSTNVTWRDLGVTWRSGVTAGGFGANTRVDYEAHFGRPRWYRARQYTAAPYISSLPSVPVQATLTGSLWALTDPFEPARALLVSVAPPFTFSRNAPSNVAYGAGAKYPTIETIGPLRGAVFSLKLYLHNEFDYKIFETMIEPGTPLLLRDPFGRGEYMKLVGDISWQQPQAQPSTYDQSRGFPVRHFHEVEGQFASVARPLVTLPDPFVRLG